VTRLRQQQLDQRIAKAEGAFSRLGRVDVARQIGSPQTTVITVTRPGLPNSPGLPNLAFRGQLSIMNASSYCGVLVTR
jgi:hypothetical protein